MNKRIILLFLTVACFFNLALADTEKLPQNFIKTAAKTYKIAYEFKFCSGGEDNNTKNNLLNHYPIIMISGNKRTIKDWLGENPGNAKGETNVYNKLIQNGFLPKALWIYQYTEAAQEMKNIESLTDGLKWFIYSVLLYTKSNKVQILAHGEGAVLAQATIKKYNLYNLIHAVVYIAGPFHGTPTCDYVKALAGSPVCSNLAIDSDFLQDIWLPDETPYNIFEKENSNNIGIKYMTIYNGLVNMDRLFPDNPDSPTLLGAANYEINWFDHDGLRCSEESSKIFIPFLSDQAIKYKLLYDQDKDGFMDEKMGGIDCNDNNPSFFPGAPETPGDNIDRNCDGMILLPKNGKDCLEPLSK